jgi:serine/threonine protein kinase
MAGSFGNIPSNLEKPRFVIIDPKNHLLLGEGAAGKVYAAHNPITNSPWAVKVYHREETEKRRVAREYEILSTKLQHAPHTIRAKKLLRSSKKIEFVMEHLQAPDLRKLICQNPTICTISMFSEIARQGLKALHFYREQGIVHSDIKPDNCFYNCTTNQLTIFDLGFAFCPKQEEWQGGSLPYLAPEILLEESASYGVDMWALGVTLFTIYTGAHMFYSKCDNMKDEELLCLFCNQFGAPFFEHVGTFILRRRHNFSTDQVRKLFDKHAIQEVAKSALAPHFRQVGEWYASPWRERIHTIAERKGESQYAYSIVRFLERIFVPDDIRMIPEEGLQTFFPNYLDHIPHTPLPSPMMSYPSEPLKFSASTTTHPNLGKMRNFSQIISHPLERSSSIFNVPKCPKLDAHDSEKIHHFCKISPRPKKVCPPNAKISRTEPPSKKEKQQEPFKDRTVLRLLREVNNGPNVYNK